ncbi:nuclear transport factor 2 family protein [Glaciimonas immobilis]|uniref:SnoaL-like domain-containing protein n=1 Tax=Glaciimonas immobilis TaxID=728004 RepID=A0A840RTH4_9BURK|nr:nuclear transport factor 2 family protein [Glaciimonas immobilis]KAF3997013.1 SnoaL-like domain-containing protein [Glaciimonas immobilis]MBB5199850.1 hypothetical protein [Glaciimonas immobilis]
MTTDAIQTLPGCIQLTHQLFYFLDESKYDALVALFEREGKWHRQGEVLAGHAQIMHAMSKRPTTQRIRHVITNSFIESQSQDMVHLVAYMVAYRFDDGSLHVGPIEITQPSHLSLVRVAMRQTDGDWKIAELTLTPEFKFVR